MKEFLLIRHGQSEANAGAVQGNESTVRLTKLGHEQALITADHLISQQFEPNLIVSSPLLRAKQTAEPLIERYPEVPVEIWPIQEFHQINPTVSSKLTIDQLIPLFDEHWTRYDPDYRDGDGAESLSDFICRIDNFKQRLKEQPAERIVVYSHGYFLKTLLVKHFLGSGEKILRHMQQVEGMMNGVFWIDNCGIISGRISPDGEIFLTPFSADHIDPELRT